MASGRVKWFNETKGFGFIEHNDGHDVFVHYSALVDAQTVKTLPEGAQVSFDIIATETGPQAQNVKILTMQEEVG
ncbi:MAG: cold shock domain-containing protein [Bdellovibrionales bacterium]|nr:cold shock domain-containing protein [Bdellovibrionales bacterium]